MRTPLASTPLCLPHENYKEVAGEFCFSTLVMLFILQAAIGLGNIAFFCFGLSYIDDNVREHNSPALIGNRTNYIFNFFKLSNEFIIFVYLLPQVLR